MATTLFVLALLMPRSYLTGVLLFAALVMKVTKMDPNVRGSMEMFRRRQQ